MLWWVGDVTVWLAVLVVFSVTSVSRRLITEVHEGESVCVCLGASVCWECLTIVFRQEIVPLFHLLQVLPFLVLR